MPKDKKGRRIFPHDTARNYSRRYWCAECGGAILLEMTLDENGKLTDENLVAFCQVHPTARFVRKGAK